MVVQSEKLEHILAEIESEHQTLVQLLSGLAVDQASSRPNGEWSAIDVLAHITAWQDNALRIARLQAMPNAPVLNPRNRLLSLTHWFQVGENVFERMHVCERHKVVADMRPFLDLAADAMIFWMESLMQVLQ
jgi:hypothetical protein